jgi:quercetin dioxygenase-like cupin family protein
MKLIKNNKWISGESYKKKVLIEDLKGKINLIQEAVVEPHGEIPIHGHEATDELFYITENSAVMIVDDKEFAVKPGDLIYVEKHESHGFKNKSDKEFKMMVFKINFKKGDSYLR